MTDKELRRLRRVELLEMMLESRESAAAAEAKLEEERAKRLEVEAENRRLQETFERLRRKLDDKDEKIHALKEELAGAQDKRMTLTENTANVAEATVKLNGAIAAAKRAQMLFETALENVRKRSAGEGDRP